MANATAKKKIMRPKTNKNEHEQTQKCDDEHHGLHLH